MTRLQGAIPTDPNNHNAPPESQLEAARWQAEQSEIERRSAGRRRHERQVSYKADLVAGLQSERLKREEMIYPTADAHTFSKSELSERKRRLFLKLDGLFISVLSCWWIYRNSRSAMEFARARLRKIFFEPRFNKPVVTDTDRAKDTDEFLIPAPVSKQSSFANRSEPRRRSENIPPVVLLKDRLTGLRVTCTGFGAATADPNRLTSLKELHEQSELLEQSSQVSDSKTDETLQDFRPAPAGNPSASIIPLANLETSEVVLTSSDENDSETCLKSESILPQSPQGLASKPQAQNREPRTELPSAKLARAFFTTTRIHLELLQTKLEALRADPPPARRDQLMGEMFASVHVIASEAGFARVNAAFRLGCGLKALFKKMMESALFYKPCMLDSAAEALATLDKLYQAGSDPDLTQPVQLLVVAEDATERRAIRGALQLVFTRPDSAESGQAALQLTQEKSYDLVFLDVSMPGLDGFEICSNLQESPKNRLTPVVFVCSDADTESQQRAQASGCMCSISKPVLPCEIQLLALSHIVRRRLEKDDGADRFELVTSAHVHVPPTAPVLLPV